MDATRVSPWVNLFLPGFFQIDRGDINRGIMWACAILFTAPLILPPIILWFLCLAEALRLDARR